MKLKVKFDFIQNLDKQMEKAPEEELRLFEQYKDIFLMERIENFKENLKQELNYDDYCWIENLEVKIED
ncbi:MAG: hypothetical protein E7E84_07530 [Peptoniphilus lacydonensis]|uniref:hypothetical protein n=1 Tax=Peptoniphilus lacydonensis TaxID=1673725 RepID=UPI002902B230|nr:hypothetical protein [Peptoniphilus lacydonensis]MDU2116178.1 hypothetical protein [Peptoniphilus lacydonensis]